MRQEVKSRVSRTSFFTLFALMGLFFGGMGPTKGFGGQPEFVATEVHQVTGQIYGLAWGEFDSNHDGMEAACLLSDGSVLQLSPGLLGWDTTLRYDGEAENMWIRPTIGIGDVHSAYPGKEIVTGYVSSTASLVTMVFYNPAAGWLHEVLFDSTGMGGRSWGARVGDFDPRRAGDEILHIYEGFGDTSIGTVFSEVAGTWEEEIIYSEEVGYDSAAGDFNPDHPGPEIVIVTEIGRAYEILPPEGASSGLWPRRTIWVDDNAGLVVKIADIDPCSPGNELVYGTSRSNRIMMSRHNGEEPHDLQILFTGNATEFGYEAMLDIAIGDILPKSDGLEILGVDYTGSVYLVRRVEDTWQGQVIWQDSNSLYAVIAGDFLPDRLGDEILVAGESGKITMLTLAFKDSLIGDGKVEFENFAELAYYWLQNEPSVDIAPWPYGDGIVNVSDLVVLADNWLQAAYWFE